MGDHGEVAAGRHQAGAAPVEAGEGGDQGLPLGREIHAGELLLLDRHHLLHVAALQQLPFVAGVVVDDDRR